MILIIRLLRRINVDSELDLVINLQNGVLHHSMQTYAMFFFYKCFIQFGQTIK